MVSGAVLVVSGANLSSLDLDICAVDQLSVLGAAIDGAGDDGRAADFQVRAV